MTTFFIILYFVIGIVLGNFIWIAGEKETKEDSLEAFGIILLIALLWGPLAALGLVYLLVTGPGHLYRILEIRAINNITFSEAFNRYIN